MYELVVRTKSKTALVNVVQVGGGRFTLKTIMNLTVRYNRQDGDSSFANNLGFRWISEEGSMWFDASKDFNVYVGYPGGTFTEQSITYAEGFPANGYVAGMMLIGTTNLYNAYLTIEIPSKGVEIRNRFLNDNQPIYEIGGLNFFKRTKVLI